MAQGRAKLEPVRVPAAGHQAGLDESEIDVALSDDRLTIRGENHEQRAENERSYGAFERAIVLPPGSDAGRNKAAFENGVLTVTMPKTAAARKARKVAITAK